MERSPGHWGLPVGRWLAAGIEGIGARNARKNPAFSRNRFVGMRRSITSDNEDGFRDGFCRAHPLMSWRVNGKILKIIGGGQPGLNSVGENAG